MSDIVRLHTRPEEPERFFSPERRSIYLDKDITEGSFVDNGFKIEFEIKFRLHFTTKYIGTGYTVDYDFKNRINGLLNNDDVYCEDKLRKRKIKCINVVDVSDSSVNKLKENKFFEVECEIETSENLILCPFRRKHFKKNILTLIEDLKSKKKITGYDSIMMKRINENWLKQIKDFNWEFKEFEVYLNCYHEELNTFKPTYHIEYFYIKDGTKYLDYNSIDNNSSAILFNATSIDEANNILDFFDTFQAKVST